MGMGIEGMGTMGPRQADGSLPNISFLRLAAGSKMIDKGTDVGLPFVGTAPDLGAYEYGAASTTGSGGTTGTGGTTGAGGSTAAGSGGRGGAAGSAADGIGWPRWNHRWWRRHGRHRGGRDRRRRNSRTGGTGGGAPPRHGVRRGRRARGTPVRPLDRHGAARPAARRRPRRERIGRLRLLIDATADGTSILVLAAFVALSSVSLGRRRRRA